MVPYMINLVENISCQIKVKYVKQNCFTLKPIEIYTKHLTVFIRSTYIQIGVHCQNMKLYHIYVL